MLSPNPNNICDVKEIFTIRLINVELMIDRSDPRILRVVVNNQKEKVNKLFRELILLFDDSNAAFNAM